MNKKIQGFTLIEMSVVLVIVGLLVGGIILGQSLIRQSQVNGTLADEQQYVHAIVQFQQKYNAMPGDFANATAYWGAMSTCPPTPGSASPGGTLTCNGNGNGQVENGPEDILFWQHLANAQLIQGQYTGIATYAGDPFSNLAGVNVPEGRLTGSAYGVGYIAPNFKCNGGLTPCLFLASNYGHALYFGGVVPVAGLSNTVPARAILTTAEALALDNKYDDGLPGTGNIVTWLPSYLVHNCATTSVASTAIYNTSSAGPQCSLIFITGF